MEGGTEGEPAVWFQLGGCCSCGLGRGARTALTPQRPAKPGRRSPASPSPWGTPRPAEHLRKQSPCGGRPGKANRPGRRRVCARLRHPSITLTLVRAGASSGRKEGTRKIRLRKQGRRRPRRQERTCRVCRRVQRRKRSHLRPLLQRIHAVAAATGACGSERPVGKVRGRAAAQPAVRRTSKRSETPPSGEDGPSGGKLLQVASVQY